MTRGQAIEWALKQIVDSIPRRGADWIDPDVERMARDLLKQPSTTATPADVIAAAEEWWKKNQAPWRVAEHDLIAHLRDKFPEPKCRRCGQPQSVGDMQTGADIADAMRAESEAK